MSGPELTAPGGRRYAAGDRIVVLAPLPNQGLVTSERLTVTDVDLPGARLLALTAEARPVVLSGDAIDRDHLDHGYAVTVHRAQGATYDRAHVLAAGGGRELAYVAMSRARHRTTLHTVADDLDQARHDLAADWNNDQHQRWITETSTLAPPTKADLHRQLVALETDLRDLHAGTGRWEDTPEGAAARRLHDVRHQLGATRNQAAALSSTRRERRTASRTVEQLGPEVASATAEWDALGRPAANDLRDNIKTIEQALEAKEVDATRRQLAALIRPTPDGLSIDAAEGRQQVPEHQIDHGLSL